jgi:tRNA-2-methylthio-N6-dimethylallyladenosine synthase
VPGPAVRRVWIETYGCQMNKAESEALVLELRRDGWVEAGSPEQADVVVLNTCSVRETAEERIQGRIGFYRKAKRNRPFRLVLMGCMAERLKERAVEEYPEIDLVVGSFQKKRLPEILGRTHGEREPMVLADGGPYEFAPMHSTGGVKSSIPIMHGCDNFCAYCIVPFVRGREVSRSPGRILAEIAAVEAQGVREITLLGQNVNSYRHREGAEDVDFPRLLRLACAASRTVRRIRFLTSHPKDLSRSIVETMRNEPKLCAHIHLPVQSGSSRILDAMNRRYTAEDYLAKVDLIRGLLPDAALTTDILVGFPGESDGDFRETIGLLERVGFEDAFLYRYNPREGTAACALKDCVPESTMRERLTYAIETQRKITRRVAERKIGRTVEVLVEGPSRRNAAELLGRTEWDSMAVISASDARAGDTIRVRLASLSGSTFRADPV